LSLIEQIQDQAPILAAQLRQLVGSLNMEPLLRLIEQTAEEYNHDETRNA
jgi:hypothetical protein